MWTIVFIYEKVLWTQQCKRKCIRINKERYPKDAIYYISFTVTIKYSNNT